VLPLRPHRAGCARGRPARRLQAHPAAPQRDPRGAEASLVREAEKPPIAAE
jgi:hypothetical protein